MTHFPPQIIVSERYSEARKLSLSVFRTVALPMANIWTESVGKPNKIAAQGVMYLLEL